ncbi:hypothetical protein [Synechococcus sp. ATX 2A4]|uniref:hypothetical protein n=1 Tax=Synechococcus sp. ATX 2A4 TaxID=2823727 RepID=UPI0020CD352D|nr:hypothetical protein [Synechococcus sp. ATX 2A4]
MVSRSSLGTSGKGKSKGRALSDSSESAFQVPGTTVFVGRQRRELASIDILQFNAETIQ